ncbi:hypothetical protein M426DRAFT_13615 [Hypoxylon sp. CI-4A]|nr:hypothetical protein M426DRAFT_13615 [Hypoxylon sp. CI-4A]
MAPKLEIDDVGGAPFSILRPILLRVDNPEQLLTLEENSPHIRDDTGECWQRLINRDFPVLAKKHRFEPRNPASWHKIYRKYAVMEAEAKREAEEKLKNSFSNMKKEKQDKAVKAINFNPRTLGPVPGRRKGIPGPRGDSGTGGLRFTGGSRTKTNTGQSILRKARREAAEIGRRNRLVTSSGQLPVPQGQITRAPKGMQEEHRTAALPKVRRPQVPRPALGATNRSRESDREKQMRERLLNAKNGIHTKGATIVSDDDLDDQDELFDEEYESDEGRGGLNIDDLEDVFEEEKPTKSSYAQPMTSLASRSKASSSNPAPATKPASSNLSGLAKMKMGRAHRDKVITVETPVSKPSPKPTASASSTAPKLPAHSPPSGSPDPESLPKAKPPMPGQKRKAAPSVFMKPKPKVRRMS